MSTQTSGSSLGAAKEHAATTETTQSRKKTGFMDLPEDVRDRIYMEMDLPIDKVFHIAPKSDEASQIQGTVWVWEGKRQYNVAVAKIHNLHVSMMLACKDVNAEISAIVYGNNKFMFESGQALTKLKAVIQGNFTHIKKLDVDITSSQASVIRELIVLEKPVEVVIHFECYKDQGEMFKFIMAFITLRVVRRTDGSERGYYNEFIARDIAEQQERLHAVVFSGGEDLHEIWHEELVEHWEGYVARKHGKDLVAKRKVKVTAFDEALEVFAKFAKTAD